MDRILNYDISDISNISVEKYLKSKNYTTNIIKNLKKMNESVLLDGRWAYMNEDISRFNNLCIHIKENENSQNIIPRKIDFKIAYEDEDILIVDKTYNMPIHPSLNNYDNTLANAIMYYYNNKQKSFVYRCINRLDRDTSGLTIIAKNMLSAGILYNQMKDRKIKRTYLALVYNDKNNILKAKDTLDFNIAREDNSLIKRVVSDEGVSAITHYEVVKYLKDSALIKLNLDTGRTHQIRVHLSHIVHPLIGDDLYKIEPLNNCDFKNLEINRTFLHSYKLEFVHPITDEKMEFISELHKDMDDFCKMMTC